LNKNFIFLLLCLLNPLSVFFFHDSLAKERVSYVKELEKQQQKVDGMKAENPDEYNIKKQVSCVLLVCNLKNMKNTVASQCQCLSET
jgi:Tubulin binding cofactor A